MDAVSALTLGANLTPEMEPDAERAVKVPVRVVGENSVNDIRVPAALVMSSLKGLELAFADTFAGAPENVASTTRLPSAVFSAFVILSARTVSITSTSQTPLSLPSIESAVVV